MEGGQGAGAAETGEYFLNNRYAAATGHRICAIVLWGKAMYYSLVEWEKTMMIIIIFNIIII